MIDIKRRDELIFGSYRPEVYGINGCGAKSFRNLDYSKMRTLMEEGFIDPDDAQNESPTAGEFGLFLEEHKTATVRGYTISDLREDCRVSITAVDLVTADIRELCDFVTFARSADEFRTTWNAEKAVVECHAWWD